MPQQGAHPSRAEPSASSTAAVPHEWCGTGHRPQVVRLGHRPDTPHDPRADRPASPNGDARRSTPPRARAGRRAGGSAPSGGAPSPAAFRAIPIPPPPSNGRI
ncbi:hypothetical protein GCM10009799_31730 [Nocardiopsis rhodophaea]|uniref:Uncharacterized protein n=1 Tax=Nocardiopsis rhodophaea TaxID=280238 RepID=A0ABN2T9B5_9ACTN